MQTLGEFVSQNTTTTIMDRRYPSGPISIEYAPGAHRVLINYPIDGDGRMPGTTIEEEVILHLYYKVKKLEEELRQVKKEGKAAQPQKESTL